MQTFDFYKDEKNTIWVRTKFSVEAENYKQALEKIKEVSNGDHSIIHDNQHYWEYLEETLEEMTPAQNEGQSTCEIHCEYTNQLIYTNETKTN